MKMIPVIINRGLLLVFKRPTPSSPTKKLQSPHKKTTLPSKPQPTTITTITETKTGSKCVVGSNRQPTATPSHFSLAQLHKGKLCVQRRTVKKRCLILVKLKCQLKSLPQTILINRTHLIHKQILLQQVEEELRARAKNKQKCTLCSNY